MPDAQNYLGLLNSISRYKHFYNRQYAIQSKVPYNLNLHVVWYKIILYLLFKKQYKHFSLSNINILSKNIKKI